jgi:hypothetical protein
MVLAVLMNRSSEVVMRTRGRRGEGLTEYVVVLSIIMICAIVGLLKAGSNAINKVATRTQICVDCNQELEDATVTPPPPGTTATVPASTTGTPATSTPAPEPTFWSSLSSWWNDSYLASFMGLFGWFAFF